MQTIANYPDLVSAQLAQSLLEAEGIESSIPDEHLAGVDWRMSTALHGIRLQVGPDDAEEATALLNDGQAVDRSEIVPPEREDLCPSCGSDAIGPARWRRRLKAATMLFPVLFLVLPIFLAVQPTLVCGACGHRWTDSE